MVGFWGLVGGCVMVLTLAVVEVTGVAPSMKEFGTAKQSVSEQKQLMHMLLFPTIFTICSCANEGDAHFPPD